jgi:hypothetical protein
MVVVRNKNVIKTLPASSAAASAVSTDPSRPLPELPLAAALCFTKQVINPQKCN